MENVERLNQKRREKSILTVKKILLRQLVFFPLCLLALAPLFLFFALFWVIFTINSLEATTGIFIFLNAAGVLASGLIAFLLSFKFKQRDEAPLLKHRAALFAPILITAAAVAFAYIFSSAAALVLSFALNPIASPLLASLLLFDQTVIPTFIILCVLTYGMVFWLMTRRCYKGAPEKRALKNGLNAGIAAAVCLCLAFCAVYQYPEFEYKALKQRYENIPFNEEVDDYRFGTAFPFLPADNYWAPDNILVTLDGPSALQFPDVAATPRLDGATAFYPVYAAFAQAAYAGFEEYAGERLENLESYTDPFAYPEELFLFAAREGAPDEYDILSCTKTGAAYQRLVDKKVDMIFAFEPSAGQIAAAAARGEEFELTQIGYDAFCFFVNTENPVGALAENQVRDIYGGKITNWRRVGGKNKRIFAFTRPKGSGSQTAMENSVMKGKKIDVRYEARSVSTMGGAIRVVDGYLNSPAAIGYTFMYYSSAMVTSDAIKYLAINGVAPTPESVRSREYAYTQPFYAVTLKSNACAGTAALLEWAVGPQGQEIIGKTGYVTLETNDK